MRRAPSMWVRSWRRWATSATARSAARGHTVPPPRFDVCSTLTRRVLGWWGSSRRIASSTCWAVNTPRTPCTVSSITSSPGRVWTFTAISLAIVAEGTKRAASLPRRAATRSWRALTVGSSCFCSSPTGACIMNARISVDGRVAVSLERSISVATGSSLREGREQPGDGLQEAQILRAEGAYLVSVDVDLADDLPVADDGDHDLRPRRGEAGQVPGIGRHVGDHFRTPRGGRRPAQAHPQGDAGVFGRRGPRPRAQDEVAPLHPVDPDPAVVGEPGVERLDDPGGGVLRRGGRDERAEMLQSLPVIHRLPLPLHCRSPRLRGHLRSSL